uniref:Uncharacterized protein n=1 Tax=Vespula pensylvanica TaxID=30213 RepID=A0A834JT32_VESPE|nr:hypothetical protein H0235_017473 [Vespula pensylvanica]
MEQRNVGINFSRNQQERSRDDKRRTKKTLKNIEHKILPDKIPVLAVSGEDIKSGTSGENAKEKKNEERKNIIYGQFGNEERRNKKKGTSSSGEKVKNFTSWRSGGWDQELRSTRDPTRKVLSIDILNTKKSEEILRRKGSIMNLLGGVKNSKPEGCF